MTHRKGSGITTNVFEALRFLLLILNAANFNCPHQKKFARHEVTVGIHRLLGSQKGELHQQSREMNNAPRRCNRREKWFGSPCLRMRFLRLGPPVSAALFLFRPSHPSVSEALLHRQGGLLDLPPHLALSHRPTSQAISFAS